MNRKSRSSSWGCWRWERWSSGCWARARPASSAAPATRCRRLSTAATCPSPPRRRRRSSPHPRRRRHPRRIPGCAISPPDSSPPCSSLAASIELNQPQPSAIQCDGSSTSLLHVTLRNRFGNVVDDGTPVEFSASTARHRPTSRSRRTARRRPPSSLLRLVLVRAERERPIRRNGDRHPPPLPAELGLPTIAATKLKSPLRPDAPPLQPVARRRYQQPARAVETPISPPICFPGQTSPPCTPLSPPECDPNVQTTPPMRATEPTSAAANGGTRRPDYIGTPELVDGKIRVPVNTTESTDPYSGFNIHLLFNQATCFTGQSGQR